MNLARSALSAAGVVALTTGLLAQAGCRDASADTGATPPARKTSGHWSTRSPPPPSSRAPGRSSATSSTAP